jgi:hypothetical protein
MPDVVVRVVPVWRFEMTPICPQAGTIGAQRPEVTTSALRSFALEQ